MPELTSWLTFYSASWILAVTISIYWGRRWLASFDHIPDTPAAVERRLQQPDWHIPVQRRRQLERNLEELYQAKENFLYGLLFIVVLIVRRTLP